MPTRIKLKLNIADKPPPFIDNEGNLIVKNSFGEIKEAPPVLFQNNQRIDSKWLIADDYITIDLSSVNNNLPLTIDPQVFWSTYAGGGSTDRMCSVFSDNNNLFICGGTYSNYFPTQPIDGSSYIQSYVGSGDILTHVTQNVGRRQLAGGSWQEQVNNETIKKQK